MSVRLKNVRLSDRGGRKPGSEKVRQAPPPPPTTITSNGRTDGRPSRLVPEDGFGRRFPLSFSLFRILISPLSLSLPSPGEHLNGMIGLSLNARKCSILRLLWDWTFLSP